MMYEYLLPLHAKTTERIFDETYNVTAYTSQ